MKKIILLFVLLTTSPILAYADEVYDPLEKINRGTFWFNEKLDIHIFQHVAHGYDWAMPDIAQTGVRNFFKNLRYPVNLVNDILLLDFKQAAKHTGRFIVNTTFGFGGLVDFAKMRGLTANSQDFGTTLGRYGVKGGPYLVLPFLGPSNIRDTVGLVGDFATHPVSYQYYVNDDSDALVYTSAGLAFLDNLQLRSDLDEEIKSGREASLDYYLFVRKAYQQHRDGKIKNKKQKTTNEESLDEMLLEDED
jgi:phospholipid-binding lipoprotein MlaA